MQSWIIIIHMLTCILLYMTGFYLTIPLLSLSPSLPLPHSLSLTPSPSLPLTHSLSLTPSHSLPLPHSLSLTLPHSLPLPHRSTIQQNWVSIRYKKHSVLQTIHLPLSARALQLASGAIRPRQLCSLHKVLTQSRRSVSVRHCRVANSNHPLDAFLATCDVTDREESDVLCRDVDFYAGSADSAVYRFCRRVCHVCCLSHCFYGRSWRVLCLSVAMVRHRDYCVIKCGTILLEVIHTPPYNYSGLCYQMSLMKPT